MRSRFLLLGALLATAAPLAACSTGPGPLGDGGTEGTQCVPGRQGHPLTMGIYSLDNQGSSPVTVHSVTLPARRGMTMTKLWLTPIFHTPGHWELIGTVAVYPPGSSPEWAKRQPVSGAVIRPGEDLNLVFGLTRTGAGWGKSDGPLVTYSAGSNTYTVQEQTDLVVAAGNGCINS
jgi:hypothetical protein